MEEKMNLIFGSSGIQIVLELHVIAIFQRKTPTVKLSALLSKTPVKLFMFSLPLAGVC